MHFHLKAAILSTFLLPGLGQLYKGEKVKGIVIIVLVNIFLLAALFLVLRGMGPLLLAASTAGPAATAQILDQLRHNSPGARWLLTAFAVLWLASALDAALATPRDTDHRRE